MGLMDFLDLCWLGRGLGSLIGQARQQRTLDLGQQAQVPPPPPTNPRALDFQAAPAIASRLEGPADLSQQPTHATAYPMLGPYGLGPSLGPRPSEPQEPRPAAATREHAQVQNAELGFAPVVGETAEGQDPRTRPEPQAFPIPETPAGSRSCCEGHRLRAISLVQM